MKQKKSSATLSFKLLGDVVSELMKTASKKMTYEIMDIKDAHSFRHWPDLMLQQHKNAWIQFAGLSCSAQNPRI